MEDTIFTIDPVIAKKYRAYVGIYTGRPEEGAKVYCECGTGTGAYIVVLEGKDRDVFERLKDNPARRGLEGEALVAAILQAAPKGGIWSVTRFDQEGQISDGPGSEPGFQQFNDKSILTRELHYQNGEQNDGADGTAGERKFNDDGQLIYEGHYQDGSLNDLPDGTSAERSFYANGVVAELVHKINSALNDTADGSEAIQRFYNSGKLKEAIRYQQAGVGYGLGLDGADGSPAYRKLDESGRLMRMISRRIVKGRLVEEEFDRIGFNEAGKLTQAWRCKDHKPVRKLGFLARRGLQKKLNGHNLG